MRTLNMKRTFLLLIVVATLLMTSAQTAFALSCTTGEVVWIRAYNSADGSYKQVSWQGGTQSFPGTGTDYINTNRQANGYLHIASDSATKSVSEFCVPDNVDFTGPAAEVPELRMHA